MTTATATRMSPYRLMDDKVLEAAIVDLERTISQLQFARSPIPSSLRAGYQDALDAARLEADRRRA